MKLTLTNFAIFIFIAINSFSQEKSVVISGAIYSSNKPVDDIRIVNLNNRFGTISNAKGTFEILAKEGDVLLFSSIQFENKKITISKYHIESTSIIVKLVHIVNILEEVYLHGLTGSLDEILRKLPKTAPLKLTLPIN